MQKTFKLPDYQEPDDAKLSFWMAGTENSKLGRAAKAWFSMLGRSAFWRTREIDPMTCDPIVLDLLAWERGVTRSTNEKEGLYRLRVNYAYKNASDAGMISGWYRIFKRLELLAEPEKELEILERMPAQDWDVIGLFLSDARLAELQGIIEEIIIENFGRTCRRYRLVSRVTQSIFATITSFDDTHSTMLAKSQKISTHNAGVLFV